MRRSQLEAADIETVLAASDLDWSEIDPSILGTLFERGLDPGKRAQLGAHYTDRDKIMLLVEPVVIRPWLAEWDAAKADLAAALDRVEAAKSPASRTKQLNAAERRYRAFLNRLRAFTVLDPACGSGNFLYLALQALKDLEHRVQLEAEALGFHRAFPEIGPANVKGIEINPYAAELARVSVWIGEIQWMRRNGFYGITRSDPQAARHHRVPRRDPDAGLARNRTGRRRMSSSETRPFFGSGLQILKLGEDYVARLRRAYTGRVPGGADLVCYWFAKAGTQIEVLEPQHGRDSSRPIPFVAARAGGRSRRQQPKHSVGSSRRGAMSRGSTRARRCACRGWSAFSRARRPVRVGNTARWTAPSMRSTPI